MDAPPKRSKALLNAVQEDNLRQAVDSAKKRAVAQAVDYDAFKNMVAAAHLKPLQAKTTANKVQTAPAWMLPGQPPSTCQERVQSTPAATCSTPFVQQQATPHNSLEFARDWRRLKCAADKYHYLQRCGAASLQQVFRADISSELLRDILATLWQQLGVMQQQGAMQQQGEVQQQGAVQEGEHDLGAAVSGVAGVVEEAAGDTHGPGSTSRRRHSTACSQGECAGHAPPAAAEASVEGGWCGGGVGVDAAPNTGYQEAARFMWQVLHHLTGAGRFQLTVQLLDRATQATTRELIHQLAESQAGSAGEDLGDAAQLCRQYCL